MGEAAAAAAAAARESVGEKRDGEEGEERGGAGS